VFTALAEFIRELIVAGNHEGLGAARARGKVGGRPTVVNVGYQAHDPQVTKTTQPR
jgi:DNA invertase Pin-like site-specific DNA recombinase